MKLWILQCCAINVANIVYGGIWKYWFLSFKMIKVIEIQSDAIRVQKPKWLDAWTKSQMTRWNIFEIHTYSVVFYKLLNLFIQSCPYLVYDMAAYGELFNFM